MTLDRGVEEDLHELAGWIAELVERGEEEDIGETQALLGVFAELMVEVTNSATMAIAADPEATPTITHNAVEKLRPIFAAAGMSPREVEARCDDFVAALKAAHE